MARDVAPHLRTDVPVGLWETNSADEHLGLMRRQVERSIAQDGRELRKLVDRIFRGSADDVRYGEGQRTPAITAWGKRFNYLPSGRAETPTCKLLCLWNFVVLNVRYEKDPPDYDLFQTAKITLERGAGDCDDFTITLCALAQVAGFERTLARVISTDGKHWSHVYAVIPYTNEEGRRVSLALDPTVKGATPGWEYDAARKTQDFVM